MKKFLLFLFVPFVCCTAVTLAVAGCNKTVFKNNTQTNLPDTMQQPKDSLPKDTLSNPPDTIPPPADTAKKYLALGDSYTIGQSVPADQNFPAQTVALLRNDSIQISDAQIIAVTGWTTINLQNAIIAQNPKGPYDAVTLLIGVNDQFQGLDTNGYRTRFLQLLQKSLQLAGNNAAHVFVLSIPDYSVTPFATGHDTAKIRQQVDEFNAINEQVTLSNNISYTDITPLTREMKNDATLIANDGLHPSAKEYAQWVALLEPKMAAVLK